MSEPTLPRWKHKLLQPLTTSHTSLTGYGGRDSSTPGGVYSNTLPSPSIVAARAYFLEQSPPIRPNFNALQRRRSLIEGQYFPRRHSTLLTPGGLTTKIAKITIPDRGLEAVQETTESEPNIKIEPAEVIPVTDFKHNDLVKVNTAATAEWNAAGLPPISDVLQKVPFQYTHDRLRDWGYVYLGNMTTADAFINPVSLRRPSLQFVKEEDTAGDRPQQSGMVTIRARVLPKARERKPFVIQRKFDIEELRVSMPAIRQPVATTLRRSSRAQRSPLPMPVTNLGRRTPENLLENNARLGKGAVPIHIEYALHFLPVLAALLLSGHVRKGDSIDLPVPHPEAWCDMVSYIYTGKGEITAGVKTNILFLAGNAG